MTSPAAQTLHVAIVDDEPLARYKIRALLDSEDAVRVVGEANDAKSAIALIDELKPDLVFLDVQMPDGTGIDVLRATQYDPEVIFTTAFDTYAITAFEVGAIDYLLKPFSRGRFQQALQRARAAAQDYSPGSRRPRIKDEAAASKTIERLFVPTRTGTVHLEIADVEYFQGQGDYVQLSAKQRTHLVPIRLREFEERLDSSLFVRIHRSFIVNIDFVQAVDTVGNGCYCVCMNSGKEIRASRRGSKLLREHMRSQ
jgi:two-component system LytT family response regulator